MCQSRGRSGGGETLTVNRAEIGKSVRGGGKMTAPIVEHTYIDVSRTMMEDPSTRSPHQRDALATARIECLGGWRGGDVPEIAVHDQDSRSGGTQSNIEGHAEIIGWEPWGPPSFGERDRTREEASIKCYLTVHHAERAVAHRETGPIVGAHRDTLSRRDRLLQANL